MSSLDHLENASPPIPSQTEAKSRKAKISFCLAVSSYFLTIVTLIALLVDATVVGVISFLLTLLTSVPALIYGIVSLRETRRNGSGLRMKNLASTGLLLGLLGSLAGGTFLLYFVARVQRAVATVSMA